MSVRKLVTISFLLACAIAISVAESLFIPTLFIPGVRLGLANIIILIILHEFGLKDAIIVSLCRVFISSACVGNLFQMGFFMSLTGAILSLFGMFIILKLLKKFSIISASCVGALLHVIGQIVIAIIYLETGYITLYLPILGLISLVSGVFNGFISTIIIRTNVLKKARSIYSL